jgi:phosphotransacetylase
VDVIAADDADPSTGVVVVDRDEADGVVGGSVASSSLSADDVRELAGLLDERAGD